MNYPILSNSSFKKYKKLLQKKYREEMRMFIIEGKHLVQEAIESNNLKIIITSNKNLEINFQNIFYLPYEQIIKLSATKTTQEIIGICNYKIINKIGDRVVCLNKINDPGNLGTIIRSSLAFNFSDVIVEGVDIYNPKTIRASQGAIFKINVFNDNNLERTLDDLKKNNYQLISSTLDKGAKNYLEFRPKEKFVLIFGNEANGIDNNIKRKSDHLIYIPIKFESLNVACAASIIMSKFTNNKKIK